MTDKHKHKFVIGQLVNFDRPHKATGRVTYLEPDHVQVQMITGPDTGEYRYFIPSRDVQIRCEVK